MSIRLSWILPDATPRVVTRMILIAATVFCCVGLNVSAQRVVITIQPPSDSPGLAFIDVTCDPIQSWSFPDSSAGVLHLASRIRNFEAFDKTGTAIVIRTLG